MKVTEFLDADEQAAAAERSNDRNNPTNGASEHAAPHFVVVHDSESPFDKLDQAADWDDIFVYGANYTKLNRPPDSRTFVAYKRPGAESDYSVKILKDNPHVVVVHSDMCGLPVGGGQKLTKGRVCAIWYHNRDEKAAATAMLQGTATYLPPHIQNAVRGTSPHSNVTEVTTHQLNGSEDTEVPSSWRPVNITAVLDGTWKPLEPSVGRRSDGRGLFYPARTHTVVSETEAGKTWFALAAAIAEMMAGCHVFYIDFEDDEGSVVGRLLSLGVDPEVIRDLFHYIRPEHPLQGTHLDALCEELADYRPSLTLLDGITEAMNMQGLNPIDNVDISTFNRRVNLPMTASGAAQASFDHVVKDSQSRGRYAIGGVHKLNIVSGAGYILENRAPFGIEMTGRSNLKIAKDRPGQLRRHAVDNKWYADLVLASDADGKAEVTIESSQQRVAEREASPPFRPTNLMEKVSKYLEGEAADSQNQILKDVPGNRDGKIAALKILKEEGYVTPAKPYKSVKPYRQSDEK
jgi:hypothetical protein